MIQVTEIKGSRSDWRSVTLNFAFTLRLVTAHKISFYPGPKWPTFPAAAENSCLPGFTVQSERRKSGIVSDLAWLRPPLRSKQVMLSNASENTCIENKDYNLQFF